VIILETVVLALAETGQSQWSIVICAKSDECLPMIDNK
jgi:hypothetical protein